MKIRYVELCGWEVTDTEGRVYTRSQYTLSSYSLARRFIASFLRCSSYDAGEIMTREKAHPVSFDEVARTYLESVRVHNDKWEIFCYGTDWQACTFTRARERLVNTTGLTPPQRKRVLDYAKTHPVNDKP